MREGYLIYKRNYQRLSTKEAEPDCSDYLKSLESRVTESFGFKKCWNFLIIAILLKKETRKIGSRLNKTLYMQAIFNRKYSNNPVDWLFIYSIRWHRTGLEGAHSTHRHLTSVTVTLVHSPSQYVSDGDVSPLTVTQRQSKLRHSL